MARLNRADRVEDDTERPVAERRQAKQRPIVRQEVAVNESNQRRKYGGFNFGAAFYGWLVATGIGVILTALLAAAGSAVAVVSNATTDKVADSAATVGLIGGILLLIVGALAYYAGGYVAGRMSRFDGARQGLGVWFMGIFLVIVLAAAGAIFGSEYNVLQQLNLPHIPVDEGTLTTGGIITLVASLVVTILAAMSGGKVGVRYHHKVDQAGGL